MFDSMRVNMNENIYKFLQVCTVHKLYPLYKSVKSTLTSKTVAMSNLNVVHEVYHKHLWNSLRFVGDKQSTNPWLQINP